MLPASGETRNDQHVDTTRRSRVVTMRGGWERWSADGGGEMGGGRRFRSVVPKLAIRRVAPPILVAARQQVEQNCRRHDRHARLANLEAATLLAQPRLSARG